MGKEIYKHNEQSSIMMKELFEIVSEFDKARFSQKISETLVNYPDEIKDVMTEDEKLLTHYLCYVTDRGAKYQRIWDVGGYIFSQIAHEFCSKKTSSIDLLDINSANSYFRKASIVDKAEEYSTDGTSDKDNEKYCFVSKYEGNNRAKKYFYNQNGRPNKRIIFQSRFYPQDYMSILITLKILEEKYNRSFKEMIVKILNNSYIKTEDLLSKIVYSLSIITYKDLGTTKGENKISVVELQREGFINERITKKRNQIESDLTDQTRFDDFLKTKIFKQKRTWCSVRDYLKFEEYKNIEFTGKETLYDLIGKSLKGLQLPGDVWNNNEVFRNCCFGEIKSKQSLNKLLKAVIEQNEELKVYYPEQFDITFGFVQRMCSQNKCSECVLGVVNKNKDTDVNKVEKICVENDKKYCSIIFSHAGYLVNCAPDKCKIREMLNKNKKQN